MSHKPSLKFPAGCNGRAEVKAAYRFLDNEHVTFQSILKPHHDATLERIREQPVVLIPQDTTELDLTRPHEIMVGAGPLNDSARVGFSRSRQPGHDSGTPGLGRGATPRSGRGIPSSSRRMPTRSAPSGVPSRSRTRRAFAGWRDIARRARLLKRRRGRTSFRSPTAKETSTSISWKRQAVEGVRKASFIIRACQNRALVGDRRDPVPGVAQPSARAGREHTDPRATDPGDSWARPQVEGRSEAKATARGPHGRGGHPRGAGDVAGTGLVRAESCRTWKSTWSWSRS